MEKQGKKPNTSSNLSSSKKGSKVTVTKIDSGRGLKGRLAELGIYPGEIVQIIKNSKRGPMLVLVKNSTYMLGRGMAQKIFVK